MNKINLSLILTTHNSSKYILDTLTSLYKQNLDKSEKEIVIVDDKSEDNTIEIINDFKKKNKLKDWKVITKKKNKGISHSRNLGILKSKGKYISFLDDDDILSKKKLQIQLNYMKKKKIKISYTDTIEFYDKDENKRNYIYHKNKINRNNLKVQHDFAFPSIMFVRTKKLMFKESLKSVEDLVYLNDLLKVHKFAKKIPSKFKIFYIRRIRPNSLSSSKIKQLYYYFIAQQYYISKNLYLSFLRILILLSKVGKKKLIRYWNFFIY